MPALDWLHCFCPRTCLYSQSTHLKGSGLASACLPITVFICSAQELDSPCPPTTGFVWFVVHDWRLCVCLLLGSLFPRLAGCIVSAHVCVCLFVARPSPSHPPERVWARTVKRSQSTCGIVAMTSASHAEGRKFDHDPVYVCCSSDGQVPIPIGAFTTDQVNRDYTKADLMASQIYK